ncbi:unnamed protein product [Didymodactylos carnosus]|uniref:Reverse transcriptase domain-containing protein n=1 Tax=Didymodactylos carnosus TaxID=1234261 RepID=A0A815EE50_9BILA|nr:unnamed protein product [Didymodactylos carnosus]CAF1305576.1 unnamed protein product [Didymodactylos carnosus]CAF3559897.1 unnamed protein product [Didymodactylos carnosus]CAF4138333.1 unnamed protein product [Didymodactylos carnosus]
MDKIIPSLPLKCDVTGNVKKIMELLDIEDVRLLTMFKKSRKAKLKKKKDNRLPYTNIQRYHTPPPSFVKDAFQFVERIKNINYEDGQMMVSFDIESLYTNIPVYEAIEAALDLIYVDGIKPNDIPYYRNEMKELLKLAVCDVPFRFQAELYKQKDGVAMGSCLAPILADVFMIKLEQKLNKLLFNKPQLYLRYVDDVFCIFSKTENYEAFLNIINQWHQNIRFTLEVENNGHFPYLDAMIMRNNNDRRYDTTLYKKPTDTGLYLLYESNQCRRYKLDILDDNGYPSHIIRKGIGEGKVIVIRLKNPKDKKDIKPQLKLRNIFFTLPYFGEGTFVLGQRIKKICKQMIPTVDLKIAYKKTMILKSIFLPIQKGLDESKKMKNIVYCIPCKNCDRKYFEETSRDRNIRIKGHRYDVSKQAPNSKIAQHVREKKHVMNFNNTITVAHETNGKEERSKKVC